MKCKRTGKQCYRTQLAAEIVLARVQHQVHIRHRKRRETKAPTRVYQCEFCHKWHLTAQEKRQSI